MPTIELTPEVAAMIAEMTEAKAKSTRPAKGSPEAKEWGRKMAEARKAKAAEAPAKPAKPKPEPKTEGSLTAKQASKTDLGQLLLEKPDGRQLWLKDGQYLAVTKPGWTRVYRTSVHKFRLAHEMAREAGII